MPLENTKHKNKTMNLKTGHQLAGGRYKVECVLGQGGFGITYLAEQTGLARKVAVKEFFMKELCNRDADTSHVSIPSIGSREAVERFRQKFIKEARALAALNHKHIVRIIDIFEENNTAYYVMEYVGGGSLSDKVKAGALDEATALRYIRQVASALELVHSKHMMHLDIKPSNILLNENDEAVLIDFGLAKQYDAAGSQTSTTPVGISHGYAPLEQYRQGGVGTFSPATDIYSLGATLYKLLTGQTPPEAGDVMNDGLPELPPHISAPVRAAIETAMQPAVRKRPQSVGEFLALLDKNVKAENGKVETESNDDGATVVGGSVMNNEILRSAQNDKEQKSVISNERSDGEISSTDAGETVFNVVIPNVREESPKKRPFNKLLAIISVVAICIIVAIFGIKSCNDRKAAEAEAQRATAIAEQQRIDAERKAQERADSIATEQQRQEQERLAKEAAEKKRKEEERKAKEEADRLAAEKKRKEEEERKRKEAEYAKTHGKINGHEWVDLGLSVKWATCNIGAPTPGDYGNYYAWGETTTKNYYSSNTSTTYGKQMNSIAGNRSYDVARKEWGSSWRLPTKGEFQELIDNCIWTWTTQNGNNGYKVTSKKNGNSIFLPAAGWRYDTSSRNQGTRGYYWSATPYGSNTDYAYSLYFYDGNRSVDWYTHYYGRTVRPVSE